jgi:hypothetical protein
MTEPTDRDRELAAYWTERGDLRTWLASIIAHTRAESEAKARREASEECSPKARPLDEWHEDFGEVLWWFFPMTEPPYIGSPLCSNWPGYHTHWTPCPPVPTLAEPAEPK